MRARTAAGAIAAALAAALAAGPPADNPKKPPKGKGPAVTVTVGPAKPAAGSPAPNKPKPISVDDLGGDFSVRGDRYYRVLVQKGSDLAAGKVVSSLERFAALFLSQYGKRFSLSPSEGRCSAVFFKDEASFKAWSQIHVPQLGNRFLPNGYYNSGFKSVFTYNPLTDEQIGKKVDDAMRNASKGTYWTIEGQICRTREELRAAFERMSDRDAYQNLAHEATHQLCYETGLFPPQLMDRPRWLVEGIACYYALAPATDYAAPTNASYAKCDRLEVARRAAGGLAGRMSRISEVVGNRNSAPASAVMSGDETILFYSTAWSLFHFLSHGDGGKWRPNLERLLETYRSGKADEFFIRENLLTPAEIRAAAFDPPVDEAKMQRALVAFFEKQVGPITAIEPAWRRHVESLAPAKAPPKPDPGKKPPPPKNKPTPKDKPKK